MAYIPQEVIDEVIARSDICSVIGDYVQLERKGSTNLFGLCPFHQEKTPSFSVAPDKQFFYCFGCHKGGNVIKFIQLIENISFPDAVLFLAKRAGLELQLPEDAASKQQHAEYRQMLDILLDAARFFYHSYKSPQGKQADLYLKKQRKLSAQVITSFGLGYAGAAWDDLSKYLLTKAYPEKQLISLGLSRKSRKGRLYDFFRERIMFPVFDQLGQLRAFGGRSLGGSEAKYINSPDSRVYQKGKYLYALNFARKSKFDYLILCEGYLDVISLHEAGFTNSVAGLGTALTKRQAQLLAQYTEQVVLAYDSDQAGQNAVLKALPLLEQEGITAKVLLLPAGQDPDDYIHQYGKERFAAAVTGALPALDYRLYLAKNAATTAKGSLDVIAYQAAASDILALEDNAVVRELYASKVARELRISPASLLQVIEGKIREHTASVPRTPTVNRPGENFRIEDAALAYLTALVEDNNILDQPATFAKAADFQAEIRPVMQAVLSHAKQKGLSFSALLSLLELKAPGMQLEQSLLPYLSKLRRSKLREAKFYAAEALTQMRVSRMEEQREQLYRSIATSTSPTEKKNYLQQINELNKAINQARSGTSNEASGDGTSRKE